MAVPTGTAWQEARRARQREDRAAEWVFERALARLEPARRVVADHASTWCGWPLREQVTRPLESAVRLPGLTWTIGDELVVEFLHQGGTGPDRLVVHDVALLRPLRSAIRSRHVDVRHRSALPSC